MSHDRILDLNPTLAEKAKAADDAAKREFHQKVVSLCGTFAIKEAARLLGVSTGWLRTYSLGRGIEFVDAASRTPQQKREVMRQFGVVRDQRQLRPVEPPRPTVARGELKLSPLQEKQSQKAHWAAKNAFMRRVEELSEVFTLRETAQLVNVSVRFLKNYSYENDIEFAGEPRPYTVGVASDLDVDGDDFDGQAGDSNLEGHGESLHDMVRTTAPQSSAYAVC